MQPVLCLVKNNTVRTIQDLVGYLLPTVCGQAVKDNDIVLCTGKELSVDLIFFELLFLLLCIFFLTHGHPHVRIDCISHTNGLFGVPEDDDLALRRCTGLLKDVAMRLKAFGAGNSQGKSED